DWEPVAKDAGQEWEPIQQGPVAAKEAVDGTSQAPSDKADIMKALEKDAGFLSAAGDLLQAITADPQNWEPVAPKTVAQPSRAR
ncbi:hypothetical protein FY180_05180, partial [Anaplasma marginale]